MLNLNNLKIKIAEMAKISFEMWKLTYQAFMEHDLDLFSPILEKENKLNDLEKELTTNLVEFSRTCSLKKNEKSKIIIYAEIVEDLELIGDYCKDILERVQIKIEEKLLFSDDAVKEYSELYHQTEEALEKVVFALDKDSPALLKEVFKNQKCIDSLVDGYRKHHNQRLLDGICSPLACNMFLNMLDFTAQVYHHVERIAKNVLKLK